MGWYYVDVFMEADISQKYLVYFNMDLNLRYSPMDSMALLAERQPPLNEFAGSKYGSSKQQYSIDCWVFTIIWSCKLRFPIKSKFVLMRFRI
jgi:hypothetical protein